MMLDHVNHLAQLLGGVDAAEPPAHQISNALRFGGTRKLTRSFGAGDTSEWIISKHVKRANVSGPVEVLLNVHDSDNNAGWLDIAFSGDALRVSGWSTVWRQTARLFRDVSAWYHFVISVNLADPTPNDRIQMWCNGVQITDFVTLNNPGSLPVNGASVHSMGDAVSLSFPFEGYIAQPLLLGGVSMQNADHVIADFGEFDSNGVWRPIDVSGLARGTTGFLLPFDDATSTVTLGQDEGAGTNDWTLTNMAVTDQVTDTPTNNYPILNSVGKHATPEISEGGLQVTSGVGGGNFDAPATVALDDNFLFEATVVAGGGGGQPVIGIVNPNGYSPVGVTTGFFNAAAPLDGYGWSSGGSVFRRGGTIFSGSSFTNNDVVTVCVKNGNLYLAKNGVWQNSGDPEAETGAIATGLVGPWLPVSSISQSANVRFNFGATGAFTATLPSGVTDCAVANLPEPAVKDPTSGFNALGWQGNAAVRNIIGAGHDPKAVLIKNRDTTDPYKFTDVVRGVTKAVDISVTDAQSTDADGLTAFITDGFTLGAGANGYNDNGENFIGWSWAFDAAPAVNNDGDEASNVRFDADRGQCMIDFVSPLTSSPRTVGHGMARAPEFMFCIADSLADRFVYHKDVGATQWLSFHLPNAAASDANFMNNVEPSSTVFTMGNPNVWWQGGSTWVNYAFFGVPGYSKFGSYVGNGNADGPFIYLGFRPKFVMFKRTDGSKSWQVFDGRRDVGNPTGLRLFFDTSIAESSGSSDVDFLPNGVKIRTNNDSVNVNAGDYVFSAWAEHPLGGENTTPGVAR